MSPPSHSDISAIIVPFLESCDANGRKHVAGLAMAAALQCYSPEIRLEVLENVFRQFQDLMQTL